MKLRTPTRTQCFTSLHFTSRHFTSLHFTSLHFTSLHFTSRHFTSRHFTALHFTSRHVTSRHVTSRHVTSLHFTSLHFTSLHFTSLHFTSLHFTSRHFTSLHGTPLLFFSDTVRFFTLSLSSAAATVALSPLPAPPAIQKTSWCMLRVFQCCRARRHCARALRRSKHRCEPRRRLRRLPSPTQ